MPTDSAMLIDTHCHLYAAEFDADREEVVAKARRAGVTAFVVPAIGVRNFDAVRDCCRRFAGWPAYGLHPLYLDAADEGHLSYLREWLARELDGPTPPVALGEIGLDRFWPNADTARQERFFIEQLKIARDFDLPVLLHVRRAVDEVIKGLRRIGVRRGAAHAFNGSRQQAETLIALGFKLGFGGAMTYAGSTRIRALASELPIEALVLETDAPDIAPSWRHPARNSPEELPGIARVLAQLRGVSEAEVAAATSANAAFLAPGQN